MVVMVLTNCPLQLRGDLTKWMMEINTGVYVGKINARVRGKVWQRVCDNIKNGQAVLIYSTNNEQGFNIITYNTEWKPVDYEGLILMHKPIIKSDADNANKQALGFSKASKYEMTKKRKPSEGTIRVFLDIETTGLDSAEDRIIEVGMIKSFGENTEEQYHQYVNPERKIPMNIGKLTGISDEIVSREGKKEKEILEEMKKFIGNATVFGYNIIFDVEFINKACERNGIERFIVRTKDVLTLAKKRIALDNYRMKTVAEYYGLNTDNLHKALEDCKLVKGIFTELNKK